MSAANIAPVQNGSLARVALEIAEERAQLLEQMRQAFEAQDELRALGLAKRLCGVETKNESISEKQH